MESGWIKLYRKITEHWIWEDKPFSKGQAWIDMLMLANHEGGRFLIGNELIEVKRGSFVTSELKLMNRWGWSKSKVRAFLTLLENESMIVKNTDHKKTVITIVNYSDYQDSKTIERPQKDHGETAKRPQKDTNNNNKNNKNEKNKEIYIQYAEFVKMTEEEYNKLVAKYGEKKVKRMIEVLDNYKGATGRKYKSDYRAILNWVADKVLKEKIDDEEEKDDEGVPFGLTKEQWEYLLEQKRQKDEEAQKRAERFKKLPKEEQEKYLKMVKRIINPDSSKEEPGVYWIGDYIRGEAK